jgi:hypothetical protein
MESKGNKLHIKFGSLGWINFYGIPSFLTGIGMVAIFIGFIKVDEFKNLAIFCIPLIVGLILWIYQNIKLKFKSHVLNIPIDLFIENTKKHLIDEGWIIERDNKEYLQAINRNGLFRLDLLTIKRYKHKIEYNLVHHPEDSNSIASLFDLNFRGKKTLNKIIAST